jgi:hypothetical protein
VIGITSGPLVTLLARWRYVFLTATAGLLVAANAGHGRGDWPSFAAGSRSLFGADGLRVYGHRPELVLGPFALGSIRVLSAIGGYPVAVGVFVTLGVAAIWALERLVPGRPIVTLLGGAAFLVGWVDMVMYGHIDDAIVYLSVVGAVWLITTDRSSLAGVALGIALASKQWAVVALPMLFGLSRRWRALAVAVSLAVLAWGPFALVDLDGLRGGTRLAWTADDSLPARLGLLTGSTIAPDWYRLAEITAVLVVAVVVGWRCWPAVPFVAFGLRIALDPSTWSYYAAGVLLGALIVDVLLTRWSVPWWTLATFVATRLPGPWTLLAIAIVAFVWSVRRGDDDVPMFKGSSDGLDVPGRERRLLPVRR